MCVCMYIYICECIYVFCTHIYIQMKKYGVHIMILICKYILVINAFIYMYTFIDIME